MNHLSIRADITSNPTIVKEPKREPPSQAAGSAVHDPSWTATGRSGCLARIGDDGQFVDEFSSNSN